MVEVVRKQPCETGSLGRFPGRGWRAIGLALLLGAAGPAGAQGLQRSTDPEGVILDELVVRAHTPGPAWWRVSDGDSTVWILGIPRGLPKGSAWDDRAVKARLASAHALIPPPQVRVAPLKAIGFFIKHRKALRAQAPLEAILPAPLAGRFTAARQVVGKPAGRYSNWRPVVAGVMLDADFRKTVRLELDEPLDHLKALARKAGVREQRAANYDGRAVLDVLLAMPPDAERACLEDSLAEVEAGAALVRAATDGWTHGDVKAALTAQRGYERCLAALPSVSALILRGQADTASAIRAALAQPGVTVAAVELRSLLAQGGVLDRLRAAGLRIGTPDATD